MLTVKCQSCGAVYKLSEDLYSRKAAGFGVVVTCRRCKAEIHVESPAEAGAPKVAPPNAGPSANVEPAKAEQVANAEPAVIHEAPSIAGPPAGAEPARKGDATPEPETKTAPAEPMQTAIPKEAVIKAPSPSPPRVSPKATAPWPDAINAPGAHAETPPPSPVADANPSPAASSVEANASPAAPNVGDKARAESRSEPRAAPAPQLPRPAPRPAPAAGTKPLKRDPVAGPFVALSPGLLGAARPAPPPPSSPESEAPIDSSDFLDERKAGGSPKAPPARPPAKSQQNAPPAKRSPEPALPLKFKEPPKPPKQKPRAPVRSDDVSDDLLSADVGFDGTPPLDADAPRILAPDSSALAAPPADPDEGDSPKAGALSSASTSDARPRPSSSGKPSRVIPIVLVSLGAAAAFGLAFRSQLPGASAPPVEERAALDSLPAVSPPLPPPLESPIPPPPTGDTPSASSAASATATATPKTYAPGTTPRATSNTKSTDDSPTSVSSAPKPAITAPAPGTPVTAAPPSTEPEGPFNAEAARAALASSVAQASACRKPGDPSGVAVVTITFSPSGRVTSATIGGPPFAGTPTGGCIAATLRRARVPPFTGDMVTVKKTVEIR